jgi:hypothetical protein
MARLETDLKAINDFLFEYRDGVVVDVLEVRLPGDSVRWDCYSPEFSLISESAGLIDLAILLLAPFFEAQFKVDWRALGQDVIAALARDHEEDASWLHAFGRPAGFKLRCGGLEAAAFPSPEQVAFAITACRDAGVPLKFTAGLHHPIRHFDNGVQTHMYGFLNVFGAGVLAHARGLDQDQVRQVIEDEDAKDFVFDDAGFRWKDIRATTEEIAAARRSAVISFGSCSFDEPRLDLRALGLLD